jgi:glucose-6-phosphate 1-dehydrogenase
MWSEKLIADISMGIARHPAPDQVEAAWRWLMPVLEVGLVAPPSDLPNYAAGTQGPEGAQRLLVQEHNWPLPIELVGHCKKKGKNA